MQNGTISHQQQRTAPPPPKKEGLGRHHLIMTPKAEEVGHVEEKAQWYGVGEPFCMEASLARHMHKTQGQNWGGGGGERKTAVWEHPLSLTHPHTNSVSSQGFILSQTCIPDHQARCYPLGLAMFSRVPARVLSQGCYPRSLGANPGVPMCNAHRQSLCDSGVELSRKSSCSCAPCTV